MDPQELSPPLPLLILFGGIFLGCVYVWGRVIERLLNRQPVVPYEPRSLVPWRGPDLVVAFAILIVAFAIPPVVRVMLTPKSVTTTESPAESNSESGEAPSEDRTAGDAPAITDDEASSPADEEVPLPEIPSAVDPVPVLMTPELALIQAVVTLAAAAIIALALRASTGATWSDFGLTTNQPWRDISLGVGGMLAASVIVYMIQALMVHLIAESEHPLLEMIKSQPDVVNLFMAIALAALVAPIVEEFVFRGLLQGWLEVKEREWTEYYPGTIGRLPAGTIPIAISSALFAVVHATSGPDPIALFPLALILGYLYYRTHRLLPCMVMHLCFNAVSIIGLWVAMRNGASL